MKSNELKKIKGREVGYNAATYVKIRESTKVEELEISKSTYIIQSLFSTSYVLYSWKLAHFNYQQLIYLKISILPIIFFKVFKHV